jgi:hypothetical protein
VQVDGGEAIVNGVDGDTDTLIDEGCFAANTGQIAITEVYSNDTEGANADQFDWFEVQNRSWFDVFLDGWTVEGTGGETFTVGAGVSFAPGEYGIFAETAAATTGVPAASVAYVWTGTPTFGITDFGTADTITLKSGAITLDTVDTTSITAPAATKSKEVDADFFTSSVPTTTAGVHIDNDTAANWCTAISTTVWTSHTATPGVANTCN